MWPLIATTPRPDSQFSRVAAAIGLLIFSQRLKVFICTGAAKVRQIEWLDKVERPQLASIQEQERETENAAAVKQSQQLNHSNGGIFRSSHASANLSKASQKSS